MNVILEYLVKRPDVLNYPLDEYRENFPKIIHNVEKAIALITNKPVNMDGLNSVFSKERAQMGTDYLAKLEARWQEIVPELEKYKRGGKLP